MGAFFTSLRKTRKATKSAIPGHTAHVFCVVNADLKSSLQTKRSHTTITPLMEHEYYMNEALKEARQAEESGDVPVGAVIVHKGRIIARAHNQVELLKDPTAHAEMLAITQAAASLERERLDESIMYVTLEPCVMCAGALVLARVGVLFYAAPDPKAGACGSVYDVVADGRLNHKVKVVHGLMRDESQELLQGFFRSLRVKKN